MEIKSKSLDGINEITDDTKTGITTTLVHTINFEKYKKMYGGESEIFKILLEELKKGTFSDCDEEFQYCCYQIISNLQQQNKKYKEVLDKVSSQIKLYGKYNGEKCTRGFSVMTADFNKLLDILKEVE